MFIHLFIYLEMTFPSNEKLNEILSEQGELIRWSEISANVCCWVFEIKPEPISWYNLLLIIGLEDRKVDTLNFWIAEYLKIKTQG